MSFSVVTDTSANLPNHLLRDRNIAVLPFSYYMNGKEYIDLEGQEFDAVGFFSAMRVGVSVTTSQIPPQRYADCFEPLLQAGQDILFVSMSSGISGSYQSSLIAAKELLETYPDRKIRCMDSGTASLGEGLQALRAAELRDEGKTLDEAADILEKERYNVCSIFTVGNLQYLRATGRLSGMGALLGTMLNIKPVLKGDETFHIVLAGKVRGRRQVIENLAARYDKYAVAPEQQLVGVAHCDCRADADYLIQLLRRNRPPRDVLLVDYEPVTGSHLGPDSLALFFRGDDQVRTR